MSVKEEFKVEIQKHHYVCITNHFIIILVKVVFFIIFVLNLPEHGYEFNLNVLKSSQIYKLYQAEVYFITVLLSLISVAHD